MDQTDITASAGLRAVFLLVAAIMLALWGWSLVPPIQNWGNPNEDRFSYVPLFWATLTCLPVGLYLIAGAAFARPPRSSAPAPRFGWAADSSPSWSRS